MASALQEAGESLRIPDGVLDAAWRVEGICMELRTLDLGWRVMLSVRALKQGGLYPPGDPDVSPVSSPLWASVFSVPHLSNGKILILVPLSRKSY